MIIPMMGPSPLLRSKRGVEKGGAGLILILVGETPTLLELRRR
jgi:hypothetical protein